MQRLLKIFIFLAMAVFLVTRVTSGTINFYLNQRYVPLTILAAVGFGLLALGHWRGQTATQDESPNDHDHGHDHDHTLGWIGLVIVILPLILGYVIKPQPLGATAMTNREVSVGSLMSVAAPDGNQSMGLVAGEKNIMDWLSDFQRYDTAVFTGEEAHIIGFVYRDERFPEDTFMVSRFVLSCCVADAAPIGLIVRQPNASEFVADQWVDVNGRFEVGYFDEIEMPILVAESIEETSSPKQPYLYR